MIGKVNPRIGFGGGRLDKMAQNAENKYFQEQLQKNLIQKYGDNLFNLLDEVKEQGEAALKRQAAERERRRLHFLAEQRGANPEDEGASTQIHVNEDGDQLVLSKKTSEAQKSQPIQLRRVNSDAELDINDFQPTETSQSTFVDCFKQIFADKISAKELQELSDALQWNLAFDSPGIFITEAGKEPQMNPEIEKMLQEVNERYGLNKRVEILIAKEPEEGSWEDLNKFEPKNDTALVLYNTADHSFQVVDSGLSETDSVRGEGLLKGMGFMGKRVLQNLLK